MLLPVPLWNYRLDIHQKKNLQGLVIAMALTPSVYLFGLEADAVSILNFKITVYLSRVLDLLKFTENNSR